MRKSYWRFSLLLIVCLFVNTTGWAGGEILPFAHQTGEWEFMGAFPGVAMFDYDNDGDLDVVVTANGGSARILRNDGGNANHLLRVRLIGTTSNRSGIGARVEITAAGDMRWQLVKTGSSYLSQSELPSDLAMRRTSAPFASSGPAATSTISVPSMPTRSLR